MVRFLFCFQFYVRFFILSFLWLYIFSVRSTVQAPQRQKWKKKYFFTLSAYISIHRPTNFFFLTHATRNFIIYKISKFKKLLCLYKREILFFKFLYTPKKTQISLWNGYDNKYISTVFMEDNGNSPKNLYRHIQKSLRMRNKEILNFFELYPSHNGVSKCVGKYSKFMYLHIFLNYITILLGKNRLTQLNFLHKIAESFYFATNKIWSNSRHYNESYEFLNQHMSTPKNHLHTFIIQQRKRVE